MDTRIQFMRSTVDYPCGLGIVSKRTRKSCIIGERGSDGFYVFNRDDLGHATLVRLSMAISRYGD